MEIILHENFQNGLKIRKNRTNMEIILPLDKYGIIPVHITYQHYEAESKYEDEVTIGQL